MTTIHRALCMAACTLALFIVAISPAFAQGAPTGKPLLDPNTAAAADLQALPGMTPATVKNLKHMGVSSVEQLAAVTDGNLPALGMGARGLRDQAVAYLARANEVAALRKSEAENQKLREEIDALKANMDSLAAAVRAKESREAKGNAASAG